MKDFDLEAAMNGAKVIDTADDDVGEFLIELKTGSEFKFIFLFIDSLGNQYIEHVNESGIYKGCTETTLKMVPVKHKGYINIYSIFQYHGAIYKTIKEADKYAAYDRVSVATVEWEE